MGDVLGALVAVHEMIQVGVVFWQDFARAVTRAFSFHFRFHYTHSMLIKRRPQSRIFDSLEPLRIIIPNSTCNWLLLLMSNEATQTDRPLILPCCYKHDPRPLYKPAAHVYPIAKIKFNYLLPEQIVNSSVSVMKVEELSQTRMLKNERDPSFVSEDELGDKVSMNKETTNLKLYSNVRGQEIERSIEESHSYDPSLAIEEGTGSFQYNLKGSTNNDNISQSRLSNIYSHTRSKDQFKKTHKTYLSEIQQVNFSKPKDENKRSSDFLLEHKRKTEESIEKEESIREEENRIFEDPPSPGEEKLMERVNSQIEQQRSVSLSGDKLSVGSVCFKKEKSEISIPRQQMFEATTFQNIEHVETEILVDDAGTSVIEKLDQEQNRQEYEKGENSLIREDHSLSSLVARSEQNEILIEDASHEQPECPQIIQTEEQRQIAQMEQSPFTKLLEGSKAVSERQNQQLSCQNVRMSESWEKERRMGSNKYKVKKMEEVKHDFGLREEKIKVRKDRLIRQS